ARRGCSPRNVGQASTGRRTFTRAPCLRRQGIALADHPRQLVERIGPVVTSVRGMRLIRSVAALIGNLRLNTVSGAAEAEVEDAIGHLQPHLSLLPTSREPG